MNSIFSHVPLLHGYFDKCLIAIAKLILKSVILHAPLLLFYV